MCMLDLKCMSHIVYAYVLYATANLSNITNDPTAIYFW